MSPDAVTITQVTRRCLKDSQNHTMFK